MAAGGQGKALFIADVGAKILERETSPDKLKELTLCAAFLARVGYVDENFLPQENQFINAKLKVLGRDQPG